MDQHVLASELVDICSTVSTVFNQWAEAIAAQQKRVPYASALHVSGLAETAKRWGFDLGELEQSLEETQRFVQRCVDLVPASGEDRKCIDDIRSTGQSIVSAVDGIQAALRAHPDDYATRDESLILDTKVASLDVLLSYRALPLLKRIKWLSRPTGMKSVASIVSGSKGRPVTQPSESGRKRVEDLFKHLWVNVDAEIGAARDKARSRGDIELDETLAKLRGLSMHIRQHAEMIHALRTAPLGGKERIFWESSHLPMFGGETPSGRNLPASIPWQDTAAWLLTGVFRELFNTTHLFDELMSEAVSDALVNPHRERAPAFGSVTARTWSIVLRETAWQHLNILSNNRVSGRGTFPEPKSPQAMILHTEHEDFSVAGFEAVNAAFDQHAEYRFPPDPGLHESSAVVADGDSAVGEIIRKRRVRAEKRSQRNAATRLEQSEPARLPEPIAATLRENTIPCWTRDEFTLSLGTEAPKTWSNRLGKDVISILDAFEFAKWPSEIVSKVPYSRHKQVRRQLRTVPFIQFTLETDGTVRWRKCSQVFQKTP